MNFSYDKDGLVTGASATGGALTLTRDADTGMVTSTSLGTVDTATSFNPFGEVTHLSATFGSTDAFSQAIDRDALGRITHLAEVVGSTSHDLHYTYDEVGRLTEAERDGSITDYEYDANGNRTRVTVDGVETATGAYDAQDRIQSYGTATFEQTAQGDLVRRTDGARTLELTYDELGNLTKAVTSDGSTTKTHEYVVDGFGRRVAERVNGSFSKAWLYRDALRPVSEVDADGTFMHFIYASGDSAPDFILRSGTPYRVVKDHLGSVRLIVNAETGDIVQCLDYDEFGQVLRDTNPGFQPFGFAGGLYDAATGLVRFGARDYDAMTGRWVSKDPIGFRSSQSNVYVYCAVDPLNARDPSGLEGFAIGAGGSVGSTLIGMATNLIKSLVTGAPPGDGISGVSASSGIYIDVTLRSVSIGVYYSLAKAEGVGTYISGGVEATGFDSLSKFKGTSASATASWGWGMSGGAKPMGAGGGLSSGSVTGSVSAGLGGFVGLEQRDTEVVGLTVRAAGGPGWAPESTDLQL